MPKIAHKQGQNGPAARGADTLTRIAQSTTQQGADAAREGSERARTSAKAAAENKLQVVQQSAEQGWSIMELLGEQTRQNMQFATAFGRSMNWGQVAEIQRDFLAGSFDRMNRLAERYRSMMQVGMKPMAFTTRR